MTLRSFISLCVVPLYQTALFEFFNPCFGVALCRFGIHVVIVEQHLLYGVDVELLVLQLVPQQQRSLVECDDTGHVAAETSLHDYDMLAGNVAHFVSLFEFHGILHISDKDSVFFFTVLFLRTNLLRFCSPTADC